MGFRHITFLLLLFTMTSSTAGQLFDFFSGLQPLIEPPTSRPSHLTIKHTDRQTKGNSSHRVKQTSTENLFNFNFFTTSTVKPRKTTRRSDTNNNKNHSAIIQTSENIQNVNREQNSDRNNNHHINNVQSTTKKYVDPKNIPNINRKQSSDMNNNHQNYNAESTTKKYVDSEIIQTINRKQMSDRNNNNHNYNIESTIKKYVDNNKAYGYNNNSNANINNRQSNSRNPNVSGLTPNVITFKPSSYTTINPLLNRPGVKPAPVDPNRPAITNRPLTKPVYNTPVQADPISYNDELDVGPGIEIGPDEGVMTEREQQRHMEIAEKMCDKYKSMTTRKVEAIALLPSARPVRVNVSECTPITIPLVVGGKPVSIREFPHMGLVGWRKVQEAGYSWKCGSSLLSDRFVLTAGHCSYQEKDDSVTIGPPQAVQLGSTYLDDTGALVVKISSVIRHPKYKQQRSYHDIAVVKLANSITFSAVIRPACLGAVPPVGQPIIATGWGRTEYGADQSLELRSVSLPVWSMRECARVLGTSRKLPSGPMADNQMCAGDPRGGKDTCQGDSGGPAQIQDGCVWRVVAVTSLGRACGAPNTPGLYATAQRAFISAVVFSGLTKSNQNSQGSFANNNNAANSWQDYNNRPTGGSVNNNRPSGGSDNNNNRPTQSYDFNNGQTNNRPSQTYNTIQINRPTQTYDYNSAQTNNRPTQTDYNSGQTNNRPSQNANSNSWQTNDRNTNDRIVFETETYRPIRKPTQVISEKPWWLG